MLSKPQVIVYWVLVILDIFLTVMCLWIGPVILAPLIAVSCVIQLSVLAVHYGKPKSLCKLAARLL